MRRFLVIACFMVLAAPTYAASDKIRIDDNNVFPESLGSANGLIYIGSSTKGTIYRARAGSQYAEPWIQPPQGWTRSYGVLADAPSNTLWVCYNQRPKALLQSFDLKTGKAKAGYEFPDGGFCNDIAVHKSEVYATDTMKGRILKLAKGSNQLAAWWQAPGTEKSLDGLVFTRDGKLFTNAYNTGHLIRVDINRDGTGGPGTVLNTSIPLYQPDGMRLSSGGKFLLVEGQGDPKSSDLKKGRLDEVTVNGYTATIKIIKDGFELPSAVTPVGNTLYVLETKFDYQRRPEMKGRDPGPFYVYAVPFKQALPRTATRNTDNRTIKYPSHG